MSTEPRIVRTIIESVEPLPQGRSRGFYATRDRILTLGALVMARCGAAAITLPALALGLDVSLNTLQRHIIDTDYLLGLIIRRHLRVILAAFAEIPADAPDRARQQAAAYLRLTRESTGRFNPAHALLMKDSGHLPEDQRTAIATLRAEIHAASILPGELLALMDDEDFSAAGLCDLAAPAGQGAEPDLQPGTPAPPRPEPPARFLPGPEDDLSRISGVTHAELERSPPG